MKFTDACVDMYSPKFHMLNCKLQEKETNQRTRDEKYEPEESKMEKKINDAEQTGEIKHRGRIAKRKILRGAKNKERRSQ